MACKVYRTISHVLAGCIAIDLLNEERMRVNEDVSQGIPRHESKMDRRNQTIDAWQHWGEVCEKGRETYLYFPHVVDRLKIATDWNNYTTKFMSR